MKRDFQISFVTQRGLKPENTFLDIGCGTLRGGIPIIQYLDTSHYYGIEARKNVLKEGRQELFEAGCNYKAPTLIGGVEFCEVDFATEFDFVWAFSILFHMTDKILSECLYFVAQNMKDTGRFYANVHYGNQPDGFWQGFPVVYRNFATFLDLGSKNGLEVTELGPIKNLGHVSGRESQDNQMMLEFRHK